MGRKGRPAAGDGRRAAARAGVRVPPVVAVLRVPGLARGAGKRRDARAVGVVRIATPVPAPAARDLAVAPVPRAVEPTGPLHLAAPAPPPVLVDDTGRRFRLVMAALIGVAVLGLVLVGILWLSQTG